MRRSHLQSGFTLIELLVVVLIISMFAGAVGISIVKSRARAQDTKRQMDLYNLHKALEAHLTAVGTYPSTNGVWRGVTGGCGGSTFGFSGANGYIPNLAPNYVTELPSDPAPSEETCSGYVYRSDGYNFKLLSNSVNGKGGPKYFPTANEPYHDPRRPNTAYMVTNNRSATSNCSNLNAPTCW
jgi:prepilin-type N-terminal cleavage/methylation domain-containing protein